MQLLVQPTRLDQMGEAAHPTLVRLSVPALSLAALGVVFGDIGTSPLYTFKTVLDVTGNSQPATILGVIPDGRLRPR